MAKKKAKQPETSKKAEQKKKQQAVTDRTFGLKNKNKSKKVQQKIEGVKRSVMNSGDRRQRQLEEQRKKQKADAKARRKAEKDEQDALFGAALMAINKKKSTDQKGGKAEAKGRDADLENKKGTSRAMKMMFQMDAQEMEDRLREDPNYVPTIEDRIESERQKKVAEQKTSGKAGTPVTPETFAVWQEKKRKKRAEAARKLVEAELRKKKGGKGLAVLSGRDLYEYKQDLFNVADETAEIKTDDDEKMQAETKVEELVAKVESDLFLEGDDDDLDDLEDD